MYSEAYLRSKLGPRFRDLELSCELVQITAAGQAFHVSPHKPEETDGPRTGAHLKANPTSEGGHNNHLLPSLRKHLVGTSTEHSGFGDPVTCNIGALIIRKGSLGPVILYYNKEPQNSIGSYLSP